MRRKEVEGHNAKRAMAAGMGDAKSACNRCHVMKVSKGREESPQKREGVQ